MVLLYIDPLLPKATCSLGVPETAPPDPVSYLVLKDTSYIVLGKLFVMNVGTVKEAVGMVADGIFTANLDPDWYQNDAAELDSNLNPNLPNAVPK